MTKWIACLALLAFASGAAVAYQQGPYGHWNGTVQGCNNRDKPASLNLEWKNNSIAGTITDCDDGEESRLTGTISMEYNVYRWIRIHGSAGSWSFRR